MRQDRPRGRDKPYFDRLATDLPVFPTTTLNPKTHLRTRLVGERPFVDLEPADRSLAAEQQTGIGPERVREIATAVLGAGDGEQR
ncbi:DUF2199 domain-containing protein [Streptomyces sp. NPDC048568]|uniref:DUF2199 domain-containing protein n=1 Tax=Streptomyces sp. NPDC048568 TaxID=3365571 RepID=UPI00371106F7